MSSFFRLSLVVVASLACFISGVESFAPTSLVSFIQTTGTASPLLQSAPALGWMDTASTTQVAAATLDPTTLLSDLLAGLIGSPAILAVPIVLALAVASTIAYLIASYASPAEPDD